MNRTTKEERAAILEESKMSGQSIAEFCRGRGLEPKRLYHWVRQERDGGGATEKKKSAVTPGFARVQTGVTVSLELRSGLRLTVAVEGLRAVLRELEVAK